MATQAERIACREARQSGNPWMEPGTPGTGMVPIGIATLAAGNGVVTVRVRLDGVATEAA